MAIIWGGQVRMANLCIVRLLQRSTACPPSTPTSCKKDVFHDAYLRQPRASLPTSPTASTTAAGWSEMQPQSWTALIRDCTGRRRLSAPPRGSARAGDSIAGRRCCPRAVWKRSRPRTSAAFADYVRPGERDSAQHRRHVSTFRSSACTSISVSCSTCCTSSASTRRLKRGHPDFTLPPASTSSAPRLRPATRWPRRSSSLINSLADHDQRRSRSARTGCRWSSWRTTGSPWRSA